MRWNPIAVANGYNLFIDYRDQYYIYEEHIYLRVFDDNNRVYFEKRFDSYSAPENSRQASRGNRCILYTLNIQHNKSKQCK